MPNFILKMEINVWMQAIIIQMGNGKEWGNGGKVKGRVALMIEGKGGRGAKQGNYHP